MTKLEEFLKTLPDKLIAHLYEPVAEITNKHVFCSYEAYDTILKLAKLPQIVRLQAEALECVVHPKHDEPDDYTRLACAQHRVFEAQKEVNKLLGE